MADNDLIQTAISRGYSIDEIADTLAKDAGYDPTEVRRNGYSSGEMLGKLGYELPVAEPAKQEQRGDFSQGFQRAFAQVPELAYGSSAMAAMAAEKLFGEGGLSTSAKNYFAGKYAAKAQENRQYAPSVEFTDAWDNVKTDPGKMVDWLQDTAGYVVGQGLQTIATGGIGALAGRMTLEKLVAGSVAKAADKIVTQSAGRISIEEATKQASRNMATALGSGIALTGQNLGMEAGDIYGGLIEEHKKSGEPITGADLVRAWGSAGAAAATETLTDMLGLGALTGRIPLGGKTIATKGGLSGHAARAGVAAGVGVPVEAGQEWVQTGLEQYGAGQALDTPEASKERINAAAMGAVGGAIMGGGAGALSPTQRIMQAPTVDAAVTASQEALDQPMDEAVLLQATTSANSAIADYETLRALGQQADAEVRATLINDAELPIVGQEQQPTMAAEPLILPPARITPNVRALADRLGSVPIEQHDQFLRGLQPQTRAAVEQVMRENAIGAGDAGLIVPGQNTAGQGQAGIEAARAMEQTSSVQLGALPTSDVSAAPLDAHDRRTAEGLVRSYNDGSTVISHPTVPGKFAVQRPTNEQRAEVAQGERLIAGATTQAAANLAQVQSEEGTVGEAAPQGPNFSTYTDKQLKDLVKLKSVNAPAAKAELERRTAASTSALSAQQQATQEALDAENLAAQSSEQRDAPPPAQHRTIEQLPMIGRQTLSRPKALGLQAIGRITGTTIRFFHNPNQGGGKFFRDKSGEVWINTAQGHVSPMAVFGHEVTHQLRTKHADAWKVVESVLLKHMTQDHLNKMFGDYFSDPSHAAKMEAFAAAEDKAAFMAQAPSAIGYESQHATIRDLMIDEMMSDLGGNRFNEEAFWTEVFGNIEKQYGTDKAKGIIQRLADAITKLVTALKRMMGSEGFAIDAEFKAEQLDEIRTALAGAYAKSIQAHRASGEKVSSDLDVSYSQAEQERAKLAAERKSVKTEAESQNFDTDRNAEVGTGFADVAESPKRADFKDQTLPTRWPTSAKVSPSVDDNMITDLDTLKQNEKQYEKAVNAILEEPGMHSSDIASGTLDEKAEHVIERLKTNLLWLFDQVPEAIRERSKLWYDGARKIAEAWSERYEISNSQAAGMLAVLSPQKDWFMNVTMAERVLDIIHTKMDHKFDERMDAAAFSMLTKDSVKDDPDARKNLNAYEDIKGKTLRQVARHHNLREMSVWIRAYDEAYHDAKHAIVTPEGGFVEDKTTVKGEPTLRAWGDFTTPGKAASIYLDGTPQNINKMLGGEHKVRNFYNNIYAPGDSRFVTIDTHAVAADMMRALACADKPVADNFGKTGGTNITGLSGTYALHYEAYQRAASERGVLPREMQSITWEAVRGLFTEGFKGKKDNVAAIDAIWQRVDSGEITADQARDEILERAGGINHPDWWQEGNKEYKAVLRDKTYIPERGSFAGARMTFEVAPDPRNRALKARWDALPATAQAEISHKVAWKIVAKALASFGDENMKGELHSQLGGWLNDTNPSLSIWFNKRAAASKIGDLTRIVGYALNQMGMMRTSPRQFKKADGTKADKMGAIIVELGGDLSREDVHAIYADLRAAITGKRGKALINGHSTADGAMIILNDGKLISDEALTQRIGDRLFGKYKVHLDEIYADFPAKGKDNYGLRSQSQEDSGSGAEPSLRARADQLRAESGVLLDQLIGEYESTRPNDAGRDVTGGGVAGQVKASERRGAISAEGIHYSAQQRATLSSSAFGTGLKGAELERVQNAKDPRIKHRIYFYLNVGRGINPEAGVGAHAHSAKLSNIYDMQADTLDLAIGRDANDFESAVIDAGFDGYADMERGIAIMLGQRVLPVEYRGMTRPQVEQPGRADRSDFGKTQDAIAANNSLPGGQMKGADWKRIMPKLMPEVDVSHLEDGRDYYKTQVAKRPVAATAESTRRWTWKRTRNDFVVPDTPHYLNNDSVDLATYGGLPIRLRVGRDEQRFGIDHTYQNGERIGARKMDAIDGDVGEGYIRGTLSVLKQATLEYPETKDRIILADGKNGGKAVVLEKKSDFWSIVTVLPKNYSTRWGDPRKVKAPVLLDPDASTSSASYYKYLPEVPSKEGSSWLPISEWFDVTQPDGPSQILDVKPKLATVPVSKRTPRKIDEAARAEHLAQVKKTAVESTPRVSAKISEAAEKYFADVEARIDKMDDQRSIDFVSADLDKRRRALRGEVVRDAAGKLLAPNMRPSKLTEQQYMQVRTPEFIAWFGDWLATHNLRDGNGVWATDDVSKVVDPETGEPQVVHHGSILGGFTVLDPQHADKHRSPMIFTAANRETARSYSGKNREIDLNLDDTQQGIYSLFLNIRNPHEEYFEGANWDGEQNEDAYRVIDENGDPIYRSDGKGVFEYDEALAVQEDNEGSTVENSPGPGLTTNDVAEAAKRYGHDGAIIRGVLDDGGHPAFVNPDDVFVIFSANQAKSATQNTGAFSAGDEDLRYSTPRIIGDSGRNYTQAQRSLFKTVGREVDHLDTLEKIQDFASRMKKSFVQGVFDQFAPFRTIDRKAYNLMRLSKGATGAFEALMHHGKLSLRDGTFDADTSGGLVDTVFAPLGRETTDFLYWIAGNRAERLLAEGRERLMSQADIAAAKSLDNGVTDFDYVLSNGRVTRDRTLIYKDALQKFNAFQTNVLDMAEQSGLIDGASRKLWEKEFYVPFYRVMEDDGGIRGMNIKQGIVRQKAFEKLKGGEDKLGDLLSNTLMNMAHLIDASAKNRAAKAAVEAAANHGIAHKATYGEKKTVWFMDGGKKVEYKIDSPEVMAAVEGLEFVGLRGPIMDALQKPKHWLTMGVTASPFFKVRNLIRDSVQAIATSDLSYNPLGNFMQGAALTNHDRQEYVSALAAGGLIRFGTMLENNEAARTRQLIKIKSKDAHLLDSESAVQRFYDKFLEPGLTWYNELGNRGEEINRMALYKQMIDSGKTHAEAALAARDLMDFSLQGGFTSVRFVAQVVPFFNARMQGLYKLGRASKEHRAQMATVTFAAALAGLVFLGWAAADPDRWKKWKEREEWDKASNWYFNIGGMQFRIPKPFELGAVAHLAERTVEAAFLDNERDKWQRLGKAITDVAMNQLSMNPVPQAIKPIIDLYANKDSFTGRPIETPSMQRLESQYRFNAETSMPARGLSTAIGGALSPVQIDHLVQSYFGWMGVTAVVMADMGVRLGMDEPTKPALDYFKLATGGMVREDGSSSSRYVSLVYDQAKELEQTYATLRQLRKEGKLTEAKEYAEDNKEDLRRYKMTEAVKKQLSTISERIRMIERSDRHPAEKRIAIRELKAKQSEIAERLSR